MLLPNSRGNANPASKYLTDLGAPEAAYGLRMLSSTATKAIKVQRSSDNTLLDIGFIGRELDTETLLKFCAGSTGTIQTWYDQSGNAQDQIQNTLANQPIIVTAGKLETLPGSNRPAIKYDGSRFTVCSGFLLVQPITHFAVVNLSSSNPNSPAGTIAGSTNVGSQHLLSYYGSEKQFKFNAGVSITPITIGFNDTTTLLCATGDYHDAQMEVYPTVVRGFASSNGIAGLELGACQGGQFKLYGYIAEYVVYGPISQNRKSKFIENIAKHFNLASSRPNFPVYTKCYAFAGDSLTFGQNATTIATDDWPSKYLTKIGAGTFFGMNTGFPGHTIVNASVRANSESGIINYFYPGKADGSAMTTTLWIMLGTNDIIHDGQNAAGAYARLTAFITGCVNSGKFSQIGVCTIPPSGLSSGSFATTIRAYNDLIRAGASTDLAALGVNAVANIQSNSIFDDTPANVMTVTGNATYFAPSPDLTHMTTVGYDAIAAVAAAALS